MPDAVGCTSHLSKLISAFHEIEDTACAWADRFLDSFRLVYMYNTARLRQCPRFSIAFALEFYFLRACAVYETRARALLRSSIHSGRVIMLIINDTVHHDG